MSIEYGQTTLADRYTHPDDYRSGSPSTEELKEMVRVIKNCTGCFKIVTRKDGYRYAIMGYSALNNQPVYVGPCISDRALIWLGYDKLYNQIWRYAHA